MKRINDLVTECPNCCGPRDFKYLGMKILGSEKFSMVLGKIPMYKCRTCGEEESGYSLIVYRVGIEEKQR